MDRDTIARCVATVLRACDRTNEVPCACSGRCVTTLDGKYLKMDDAFAQALGWDKEVLLDGLTARCTTVQCKRLLNSIREHFDVLRQNGWASIALMKRTQAGLLVPRVFHASLFECCGHTLVNVQIRPCDSFSMIGNVWVNPSRARLASTR